jgi:hypothetical protein
VKQKGVDLNGKRDWDPYDWRRVSAGSVHGAGEK